MFKMKISLTLVNSVDCNCVESLSVVLQVDMVRFGIVTISKIDRLVTSGTFM